LLFLAVMSAEPAPMYFGGWLTIAWVGRIIVEYSVVVVACGWRGTSTFACDLTTRNQFLKTFPFHI
jgi:hypothetical protein